jgi:hypothetical protein
MRVEVTPEEMAEFRRLDADFQAAAKNVERLKWCDLLRDHDKLQAAYSAGAVAHEKLMSFMLVFFRRLSKPETATPTQADLFLDSLSGTDTNLGP